MRSWLRGAIVVPPRLHLDPHPHQPAPAARPSCRSDFAHTRPPVPAAPPNPLMDAYNEQWTTVQESPSDFNTWTALIATTEKLVRRAACRPPRVVAGRARPAGRGPQLPRLAPAAAQPAIPQPMGAPPGRRRRRSARPARPPPPPRTAPPPPPQDHLEKLRAVYDAFLALYPLCYGYWKKYADAELKRGGSAETAAAVYERGVASVPYSVDLWGHYAAFKQAQEGSSADDVRRWAARAGPLLPPLPLPPPRGPASAPACLTARCRLPTALATPPAQQAARPAPRCSCRAGQQPRRQRSVRRRRRARREPAGDAPAPGRRPAPDALLRRRAAPRLPTQHLRARRRVRGH